MNYFVLSGFLITGILYDTREASHFFRNLLRTSRASHFSLYYGFIHSVLCVSLLQGYHWKMSGLLKYLAYVINLFPDSYSNTP